MGVVRAVPGLQGTLGQPTSQIVGGSLKFESTSDTNGGYLTRTPSVAGNRKTWTWSGWIKKDQFGTEDAIFVSSDSGGNSDYTTLYFNNSDELKTTSYQGGSLKWQLTSNARFRDIGWYHIVLAIDLTQGTNSNKVKLYVNGSQLTDLRQEDYPSTDFNTRINSTNEHSIGRASLYDRWYSDYRMTQVYFVDGQQLGPENFGFTDPLTNTWKPKKYTVPLKVDNSVTTSTAGGGKPILNTTDDFGQTLGSGVASDSNASALQFCIPGGSSAGKKINDESPTGRTSGTRNISGDPGANDTSIFNYYGGSLKMAGGTSGSFSTDVWNAISSGQFTVEMWIYLESTSMSNGYGATVISSRATGDNSNSFFHVGWTGNNGVAELYSNINTGFTHYFNSSGTYGAAAFPVGQWVHIATCRDGSNVVRSYMNGTKIAQTTDSTSINVATGLFGGHDYGNFNSYQTFYLNDLRIYNTAKYTADSFTLPNLDVTGGNSFHLPMDGNSQVGHDKSGNGSDWFPVNLLSGSVSIDKATGGLPILKTTHGGNFASAGVRTDANAANLVLALPLAGDTNDISNQINSGSTTKSMTNSGSADSTSVTYFYGNSRYFDGSNDNLKTSDVSDFLSTAEYTIEGWINITSAPGNNQGEIIFDCGGGGSDPELNVFNNAGFLQMYDSLSNNTNWDGAELVTGRWYHFAQVVKGTSASDAAAVHKIYIDGKLSLTNTINLSGRGSNSIACIGSRTNDSVYGNFYLSDLRFYQTAKYESDFTVPSTDPDVLPVTPIGVSGSSKLTRITDGGVTTDNKGNSNLSVTASSDYAFGTGDFTVEGYFNIFSSGSNSCIWDLRDSGDTNQYFLKMTSSTACELRFASSSLASFNIVNKRWNHIAVSRVSGTTKVFLNGIQQSSFSDSNNATNTGPLIISSYTDTTGSSSNYGFKGTVSNFRIVKGTGLYTSTFNPSASALTNVTNTKLLCCQSPTSATEAAVIPTGSVTANGSAKATTFNPFNSDINTVRGLESDYVAFNRFNITNTTLSEGRLKFVTGGNNSQVWSTSPIPTSGKWCFESTFGGGDMAIMLDQEARRSPRNVNTTSTGLGIFMYYNTGDTNNRFQSNSTNVAFDTSFTGDTVGDVYMFEVDMDAGTVRVKKDDGSDSGLYTMPDALKAAPLFIGFSVTTTWPAVTQTFNFGQTPFVNSPADGFQPLNAANLRPQIVLSRPDQFVGVTTYTGNITARKIDMGLLAPDFVWIKSRPSSYHILTDSVRGVGKQMYSNTADIDASNSDRLTSFDPDGFSLAANTGSGGVNTDNYAYVAWAWRAGGSRFTYNKDGGGGSSAADIGVSATTLTLTGASINTTSKFGIYAYTGSGSGGATLNHGLGGTPGMVIYKKRTGSTSSWQVYHQSLGGTNYLTLDENADMYTSDSTRFGGTNPTSTTITLGTHANSAHDVILYAWCDVPGLQKFGFYEGNDSTDGPYVELGFRPAIVMVKNVDQSSQDWKIYDAERDPNNIVTQVLYPNLSSQEDANTGLDFYANGFKWRDSGDAQNGPATIIYAAWAEAPTIGMYGGGANGR